MTLRRQWAYPLLIFFALALTGASEVRVQSDHSSQLTYSLKFHQLINERVRRELSSGISTRAVILAKLIELPNHVIAEQAHTLVTKYDLWEEQFQIQSWNDKPITRKTAHEVESLIQEAGPFTWLSLSQLKLQSAYRIEIVETINPVNKERFESIQTWLSQQRLSLRGESANKSGGSVVGPETSYTSVFHELWKRVEKGEALSGEIRVETQSDPFSLEMIKMQSTQ